ncbi:hypothetical protein Tco_0949999 [Tanacetum coccineum]
MKFNINQRHSGWKDLKIHHRITTSLERVVHQHPGRTLENTDIWGLGVFGHNENLIRQECNGAPAHVISEFYQLLQFRITTYFDNELLVMALPGLMFE